MAAAAATPSPFVDAFSGEMAGKHTENGLSRMWVTGPTQRQRGGNQQKQSARSKDCSDDWGKVLQRWRHCYSRTPQDAAITSLKLATDKRRRDAIKGNNKTKHPKENGEISVLF